MALAGLRIGILLSTLVLVPWLPVQAFQPVKTKLIRSGDKLKVRLHFEAFERIEKPHFGFCLSTEMGTLVTDLHTWGTGLNIDELPPGEGSIDFEIDFRLTGVEPARVVREVLA